jgi:phage-related minor tail protein
MARNLGEAFVQISANVSGFSQELQTGVAGALKDVEKDIDKASKRIGESLKEAGKKIGEVGQKLSDVGSDLTKKVTLPIIGIGTAAFGAATTVDAALREIRVGTGATGDTLAQLEDDFRFLALNSSQSVGRVGTVVADLNTRLGLTGEPLRVLADQILDLERITGGTAVNLDTLTRVFGAFRVEPEKYSTVLDELFRASQATGVQFDKLQGLVVGQSAAFGELGFNLTDTIAILGQFEKAGVNTETVLGGLRVSIAKAASEGKDAGTFFREGISQIEAFIAAGDEAGAQAAAKELFGARTFLDALDAIRRGQFNIDGIVDQIRNGGDTISALADQTETVGEKFAMFRNKITLSLAPLGEKLFPILTQAIERAVPVVDRIIDTFTNLSPVTKTVIGVIAGVAAALGPVLLIVGKVVGIVGKLVGVFGLLANPVGLAVVAIGALVAGLVVAYQRSETFRNIVQRVVEVVQTLVAKVVEFAQVAWPVMRAAFEQAIVIAQTVAGVLVAIWDKLYAAVQAVLPVVIDLLGAFWNWIDKYFIEPIRLGLELLFVIWERLYPVVKAVVDQVSSALKILFNVFKGFIDLVQPLISGWLDALQLAFEVGFNLIKTTVVVVFNAIKAAIEVAMTLIGGVINFFLAIFKGDFSGAFNAIKDTVTGIFGTIKSFIGNVLSEIWSLIRNTFNEIIEFFQKLPGRFLEFATAIYNAIIEPFTRVVAAMFGYGQRVVENIVSGIKSIGRRISDTILDFLTPSPTQGTLLGAIGSIVGFANGGLITSPTLGLVGEAGPEAIIPLSRPRRAVELMAESGLLSLAQSAGTGGPAVQIQNATFASATDADLVAQRVNAAYRARILIS